MTIPAWLERAACAGLWPMFDESLTDRWSDEPPAARAERLHRAALICRRCPVSAECIADWQPTRDEGVRAGRRLPPLFEKRHGKREAA